MLHECRASAQAQERQQWERFPALTKRFLVMRLTCRQREMPQQIHQHGLNGFAPLTIHSPFLDLQVE
jgi:hypothetical protein